MSQRGLKSLTVVPNDEIQMQQEGVWYYGGHPQFDRVALGHLIVTEKKILFFEQRPVALSQLFSGISIETLRAVFAVPRSNLVSAKSEVRVRRRGSRPIWQDASTYRKIVTGRRSINQPAGMLDRKERYLTLIISVGRGDGGIDNLVFEVANPLDWISVLKRDEKIFRERSGADASGRIETGIDVLDSLLNGGIPRGYSGLLTTPSCDEYNILIRRFLKRVAEDGGVAIHVCVDPSKTLSLAETHPTGIQILACNPRTEVLPQDKSNLHSVRGLENLSDVNIGLLRIIDALAGEERVEDEKIVFLDTISEVLLQHKLLNTRRWLLDLLPRLKFKGYTVFATLNPYMHSLEETQGMIDLFDGEISLSEKEGSDSKWIRVKKMFNLDYSNKAVPLERRSLQP